MSIKIFSFQKDEELLIDWLEHHGNIFGFNNIYIIDHDSKQEILNIYNEYIKLGLNVVYFNGEFSYKHSELTKLMNNNNIQSTNFLIPLDGDEFIFLKEDNDIIKDKNKIINHILSFNNKIGKFKIKMFFNLLEKIECDNIFKECKYFREANLPLNRMKTFYPSKYFINTDQGNHFGKISLNDDNLILTNIVILHYAYKGYSNYIKKIKRGVEAYKNTDGNGVHWFRDYNRYKDDTLLEYFKKNYMFNEFDSNYIKIEL